MAAKQCILDKYCKLPGSKFENQNGKYYCCKSSRLLVRQTAGPVGVGVDEVACEFSTAHLGVQGNCQFIPARSLTAKPYPWSIWASLLEMCTLCPWGNEKFKCQNKCTMLLFKIHTELLYHSRLSFLLEVAWPCNEQFIGELLFSKDSHHFVSSKNLIFPVQDFYCQPYTL